MTSLERVIVSKQYCKTCGAKYIQLLSELEDFKTNQPSHPFRFTAQLVRHRQSECSFFDRFPNGRGGTFISAMFSHTLFGVSFCVLIKLNKGLYFWNIHILSNTLLL